MVEKLIKVKCVYPPASPKLELGAVYDAEPCTLVGVPAYKVQCLFCFAWRFVRVINKPARKAPALRDRLGTLNE